MTEVGIAKGVGTAHDATVLVGSYSTPELEAMLAQSRARDVAEEPARRIAGQRAKVAKFAALLAEAEAELATEIAAQK